MNRFKDYFSHFRRSNWIIALLFLFVCVSYLAVTFLFKDALATSSFVQSAVDSKHNLSSVTATFGSGATEGNILIAFCSSPNPNSFSGPTGFTVIDSDENSSPSIESYYKIADGGETSFTCTGTANFVHTMALEYGGVSESIPVDTSATAVGSGDNSVECPAVNPSGVDEIHRFVSGIHFNSNNNFTSWSNAFIERINHRTTTGGGGRRLSGVADKRASTTAPTIATVGGTGAWRCHSIALNEAFQCEDGIDNNGDGQIDYPADDGCEFPSDNDESSQPSADRPSSSRPLKVRYSGHAYPNGTIKFKARDERGNTCRVIDDFIGNTGSSGRFEEEFSLCQPNISFFSAQATDSEGRVSITLMPRPSFVGNEYIMKDIIFPPTLEVKNGTASSGEIINLEGETFPSGILEIVVDGTFISNTSANSQGSWSYGISTENINLGTHSVRVRLLSPFLSTFSSVKSFRVAAPPGEPFDLNQDGVFDISDLSIFLFRWSRGGVVDKTIDLNNDGSITISDLSIFLNSLP